ncbi:MAG: ribonuclease HI [Candidatus Pacebacteria bacterium]|nr:ribonuclease HI [Candidatus Paceibacterota bacterium]
MNILEVYTDGSSLGNPGRGGWGVIFLGKQKVFEIGGAQSGVTNNQMELLAIQKAFEFLAEKNFKNYEIVVKSDSKYFIDGIEKWIFNWQKNNWKTASKKLVKNRDLWEKIVSLRDFIELDNKFKFEHVRAHVGEKYNERVDDIARESAEEKKVELFKGNRADYFL